MHERAFVSKKSCSWRFIRLLSLFQNPHDLAVSSDGSVLFEVELRPFRVWKLANGEAGGVKPPPREKGILERMTEAIWGFMGGK